MPFGSGPLWGQRVERDPLATTCAGTWSGSRQAAGGDRHSAKIEAHGSFIRELIAEQGAMTLVEMQARLIERGASVGIGTVHRFFIRHGITRRKRLGTRSSRTVPTS